MVFLRWEMIHIKSPQSLRNFHAVLYLNEFSNINTKPFSTVKTSPTKMVFLFLASVLLAISTLAAPGPVDSIFYNNAVEVPDASSLYASVPSYPAICLTCECGKDCPSEKCGCETQVNPSPSTPPALTNSAPAPKQYCEETGDPAECPWNCRNGICFCSSYCSKNSCEVELNGQVVQMEGRCVSTNSVSL